MFTMRTSKPGKGNKFYIRTASGGYSRCIKGKPTDKNCDVLANCVGYACGRFNEIIGSMKYPYLNCNAENFIERAKKYGLKVSDKPVLGGIMVWQKGKTLNGNDGAGHVAVVEKIYNDNKIYTSESGYGGKAFWNSTRTNNNGRWGAGSGYKFRGCIINPSVKEEVKEEKPKEEKPKETKWTPKVGDIVVPIKLVDYRGKKIRQYDKKYEILQIDKRGAVLGAVRGKQRPVWAVVKVDNLKKV